MKDINVVLDGTDDSMNKLKSSILYSSDKPNVLISNMNFGALECRYNPKFIKNLEALEKSNVIILDQRIQKTVWPFENQILYVQEFLQNLNELEQQKIIDFLKNNNFEQYSFLAKITLNERFLKEDPKSAWFELVNAARLAVDNNILSMYSNLFYRKYIKSNVFFLTGFIDLLNHQLEIFQELLTNNKPILANKLLKSAINEIDDGLPDKDKFILPKLSINLPSYPNLSFKDTIRLRETKPFEKIREYLQELTTSASIDENVMKNIQEQYIPEIEKQVNDSLKLNPIIKKIVTTPGFYNPLIIGLCSIPYSDLRNLLATIVPVAIADGITVHAISTTIGSIVDSGTEKIKNKKLKSVTETYLFKPKID